MRCGHILDPPRQQSQWNLLKAQCGMWSDAENGSKVLGLNNGEEGAPLPGTGKTAEGGVREGGSPWNWRCLLDTQVKVLSRQQGARVDRAEIRGLEVTILMSPIHGKSSALWDEVSHPGSEGA